MTDPSPQAEQKADAIRQQARTIAGMRDPLGDGVRFVPTMGARPPATGT
ncbi:MAG TPA: hypothetical protein VMF61_08130 [Candidatus Acidoferrales bacterium]|nr:hypothetical protein [Candidatus Acidoferrales bacterium]